MSRARATALALVNWKGVFYERYLLDRHVTALEGANGAGKTTVMIAAYVVLMPDLSRLRFTNVGETGATGGDKGIWGRLGDLGRPSYAAMELELQGGERIVAGVHLERKAEPALDLTPFIVSGLDLQGSLRELLLLTEGDDEAVPVLADVRAAVGKRGGTIEVFATTKDYFAALFERGVMPLRMATDEDRNKLNELLRTSMTGGISRALTTELRAFLFREETGLGDALSRMRGNLDACHRTRIEVGEARRLEHEITGAYDAGHAMFAASMLATRARAEERERLVVEACAAHETAVRTLAGLDDEIAASAARHEGSAARLTAARAAHQEAEAKSERVARAHGLAVRLAEVEAEHALATDRARKARAAQDEAAAQREAHRRERDRARDGYDRAARGLADLQAGLDELHRRAHAFRHAVRQLHEAREALSDPDLDEARVDEALARVRERLAELDVERARMDRLVESASVRKGEHARAMRALEEIAGDVDVQHAHDEARRALARLAELGAVETRAAELASERERSAVLAERQVSVRARAVDLGLTAYEGPAGLVVQRRLAEAEADVRAADDEARAADAGADGARRTRDDARRRLAELEAETSRWSEASSVAARLEQALSVTVRGRAEISEARARLAERREAARAQASALKERREELLREATSLDVSLGAVHPEMLRLRDELDAELLAARFEDLDEADAARVQAELGPVAEALVVDDPAAVAQALAGRPRELETVWLVAASSRIVETGRGASSREGDVVVEETHGVRITRLSPRPTLGRRARERRASDRRAEAERMGAEIDAAQLAVRDVDALARAADRLVELASVLESGDPAERIARAREEVAAAEAHEQACAAQAAVAKQRRSAGQPRVDALRALLGEAFLLDPPDHEARARELGEALRVADGAREELRRVEPSRRVLAELVDALRAPPDEGELTTCAARREELDAERARLFGAREALDELARGRHALGFGDAERALADQSAIAPALEEQLARARETVKAEEDALGAAEAAWEERTTARQKAEGERDAIEAHAARVRSELASVGAPDFSDAALESARAAATLREAERTALETEERTLSTHLALLRERRSHAERAVDATRRKLEAEEQAARPASEQWARAEEAAAAAAVRALDARVAGAYGGRESAALWPEVRSRGEVLLDRLASARGAAECVPAVQAALAAPEGTSIELHVAAWIALRDWVKRRLPVQVANVPDPLEALDRLRAELGTLEQRLLRQESDLRGASEDVARGIEVQLRKSKNQVRRLNQNLEGVSFGSIAGIRVQMRRIDRMDQVLRALREGAAQELLFQASLPIEEALDEIFRRFGGGRGGGQRILDYREYVELAVEIRRQSKDDWELASATRLSTGEAIGVGAALMMVILTEWERDANLLRPKRTSGSLRFLFLDEANRLSQDNLGVLFDLCKILDLQLLIAAPEVARAEGNTTYRLVRRLGPDGREEVLVSGRRTIAAAPEPEPEPEGAHPLEADGELS